MSRSVASVLWGITGAVLFIAIGIETFSAHWWMAAFAWTSAWFALGLRFDKDVPR